MAFEWTRRALLGLASAAALVLAACGSGSIESQFRPSRVVVFGDTSVDVGQTGGRFTVNDAPGAAATVNLWPLLVASNYGVTLTPRVSGGTGYATAHARISAKPDAVGNSATPTVTEQIDQFLASGSFGANDLVLVSAGYTDIIAEMAKVTAGTQSADQMLSNVQQAARDLAAQVVRITRSGGTHVGLVGVYDLGKSPWAAAIGQQSLLSQASSRFNDEMVVTLVNEGRNVLYTDAALLTNVMITTPSLYGLTNTSTPACTPVDPGPGIGTGPNQLNSRLCTTATLATGAVPTQWLFADRVYFATQGHLQLGSYAFTRLRERW